MPRVPESTYEGFAGMWPINVRCLDCPTEPVAVDDSEEVEGWLDAHDIAVHDSTGFNFELTGGDDPVPDEPEES